MGAKAALTLVREIILRKRDVGMRRRAQADGGCAKYCIFFQKKRKKVRNCVCFLY